jgi:hypothetical protein
MALQPVLPLVAIEQDFDHVPCMAVLITSRIPDKPERQVEADRLITRCLGFKEGGRVLLGHPRHDGTEERSGEAAPLKLRNDSHLADLAAKLSLKPAGPRSGRADRLAALALRKEAALG